MSELSQERISRLVDESYIFKGLDDETRGILKAAASPRVFEPGEVLIREDEEGLELFIIESGKVSVSMLGPTADIDLAELGPGAVVGEVAVLTETPRTSTVEAVERVVAVSFMAETIREISAANPKVEQLLERIVEGRARHTISMIPPPE